MRARSALLDVYGDYLRPRGGRAPVAALVRMLAPLGVAAPAVRTAISRMVRQGWLQPIRLAGGPGYQLTATAIRRLDEATARVYRTTKSTWDGTFDLLVLRDPLPRRQRHRLSSTLAYLGYGELSERTWVAARPGEDAAALLAEAGVPYERFTATHAAGGAGAREVIRQAWDLGELTRAYQDFVAELQPIVAAVGHRTDDEAAFTARFRLVHAWRGFLFRDPQLPSALLPEGWAGAEAAAFFDRHAARLRPAADRYVDRCLGAPTNRGLT